MEDAHSVDVPIDDQIKCVEREINMRLRVYPRWVESKRMTQKKADQEIEAMRAVLETLQRASMELRDREPGTLFNGEVYGPAKVRADERARVLSALAPMVHSDVYVRLLAKIDKQA